VNLRRLRPASVSEAIAVAAMATLVAVAVVSVACAPPTRRAASPTTAAVVPPSDDLHGELHGRLGGVDRVARIALALNARVALVSSTTKWRVDEQGGKQLLVRGAGHEPWRIERRGTLLRIVGEGADATPWRAGPFVARPTLPDGMVTYDGKRYRGELWFTVTDAGILVVNRVPVEDYLRSVVPSELGTRLDSDRAAIQAQTIAARSYTYMRVPSADAVSVNPNWDMVATVANQVYVGADAENAIVNQAIDATTGLVLRYGGLLVDAPYSSSCGGRTATSREAWRDAREQPYLQPVEDINPVTGKPWCDIAPKNQWTIDFSESLLADAVRRALGAAGANAPVPSQVNDVQVIDRTPSGRVSDLLLRTDRGDVHVKSNDLRTVLRDPRGAMLSSTYFSVDRSARESGHLTGITLRGAGNGHGVGMCQWGAIARSRAGHDARSILAHYYPGTVIGFAD